jgi:hypothetical protein
MTLVFAFSEVFILSVAALAVLGSADMVSVFTRQSLVQIATPDRIRGRVSAVSALFIGASKELGEFESGVVARFLGPVGAVAFGGLGSLGVTGIWMWLFPSLRVATGFRKHGQGVRHQAARFRCQVFGVIATAVDSCMKSLSDIPFSVLDLSPIRMGGTTADAFRDTLDLARHAERLGFHRFWVAEHHNLPGIASAATSVVIAHIANGTSRIRVGSGGIMLPNHSPLVIAEQFGTLESLFPGRIDLGLGRAPG